MVRMVASESFNYGIPHRLLNAGEEFDALSDSDAKVLRTTGKAKDATKYKTKDVTANSESSDEGEVAGKKGARYRRSDMRAEG